MPADFTDTRPAVACRHEVCDQLLFRVADAIASYHYGIADGRVPDQRGFDLSRFDAESSNLDLAIDTAQKVDAAVGAPPDEIAGLIKARAGRAERIGNESLGG